ncbi:MAG: type III pantothenate kinase [Burkholderiaceae bacterium]
MLLLVDAGNTRIKWAMLETASLDVAALGHWSAYGSVRREDLNKLGDIWHDAHIARVVISNVAGQAMHDGLEKMLLHAHGLKPVPLVWFQSASELGGIQNDYRNPAQLGCDRFATAIGAHALFPKQTLLVATCGTATTLDAITADGHFIGGMILPGLELMMSSLARNTAQLPHATQQNVTLWPFADNTDDAIVSGCLSAQVGAIERAMAALSVEHSEVKCILSGGAASTISPHLTVAHQMVDNLVLTGLQVVATQSRG